MSRGPSKFRQGDVSRLVRAAQAATGKAAKQVEYDFERGKIVVVVGQPGESNSGKDAKNEWDEVFDGPPTTDLRQ